MASITKRGKNWRVQVSHQGHRLTATFPTKGECQQWASQQEADARAIKLGRCADKTVGDVLDEYLTTVSIRKKGYEWERKRIAVLKGYKIASIELSDLSAAHVALWRDARLKDVSGSSVCRDWNLMSHAMETARKEWKWLHENPFKGQVTRPKTSPPRQETYADQEVEMVCVSLGSEGISGRVKDAFLFALETAMRAGEIVNLMRGDLFGNHVKVRESKNGHPRSVPLSAKASAILDKYRDNETVFGLTSEQLDANFRKAKKLAGIKGKRFHDSRRTALTRLAKVFTNPLDLARVSGHKDLSMLIRVYYSPSIDDLAGKLNSTN